MELLVVAKLAKVRTMNCQWATWVNETNYYLSMLVHSIEFLGATASVVVDEPVDLGLIFVVIVQTYRSTS